MLVFKLILAGLSCGLLFHNYIVTHHASTQAKIAGYIVVVFTVIAFLVDAHLISTDNDIIGSNTKLSENGQNMPTVPSVEGWEAIGHYQVQDGLVKDTKTNLMWMRCSLGQRSKKNWYFKYICDGDEVILSWDLAKKVADENGYASYDDWRIPTIEELNTLVLCTSEIPKRWNNTSEACIGNYSNPTIMEEVFPDTSSGYFWTSTPTPLSYDFYGVYVVSFSNGSKTWTKWKWREEYDAGGLFTKNIKTRENKDYNYIRLVRNM